MPKTSAQAQCQSLDLAGSEFGRSILEEMRQVNERLAAVEMRQQQFEELRAGAFENRESSQRVESVIVEDDHMKQDAEKRPAASAVTAYTDLRSRTIFDGPQEKFEVRSRNSFYNQTKGAYTVQRSIWDSLLFAGMQYLPLGASLVLMLCFVFNVFLVGLFINMVYTQFIDADFDETSERELKLWRNTVAHDVSLRNAITGESLASGVCSSKISLPYSNLQSLFYQALDKYLSIVSLEISAGQLMCSLALICWYLTLLADVRDLLDQIGAFLWLPHIADNFIDCVAPRTLRLNGLTKKRKGVLAIIWIMRFIELGMLAWSGTFFMIYTHDVKEILLNASALELILRLDESIFNALCPKVVHTMVLELLPIEFQNARMKWHSYGEAGMLVSILLICYTATLLVYLNPFVDVLTQNRDAICGGIKGLSFDFVIAIDALGIPWASLSKPSLDKSVSAYAQYAVAEATKRGFPAVNQHTEPQAPLQPDVRRNRGYFMEVATPLLLDSLKRTLPEFTFPENWGGIVNPEDWLWTTHSVGWDEIQVFLGTDFGDAIGTVFNQYLRHSIQASSTENATCASVPFSRCVTFGKKASDLAMRKLCPSRCGCDKPLTGAVGNPKSVTGFGGCAAWNFKRDKFEQTLRTLPCTNTASSQVFSVWALGLGDAGANTKEGLLMKRVLDAFAKGGCSKVVELVGSAFGNGDSQLYGYNMCTNTALAAICPVSCGCNSSATFNNNAAGAWVDFCPHSCQKTQASCMTKAVDNGYSDVYGPHTGFACFFPFTFAGKSYDRCITNGWFGPWCPITVENGGADRFGDCEDAPACKGR